MCEHEAGEKEREMRRGGTYVKLCKGGCQERETGLEEWVLESRAETERRRNGGTRWSGFVLKSFKGHETGWKEESKAAAAQPPAETRRSRHAQLLALMLEGREAPQPPHYLSRRPSPSSCSCS